MAERTFIKEISEAKLVLRYENMKPEDQFAYNRHIENRRIELSVTETAEDRGKRKRSIDIAKKALENGLSYELISTLTELPLEEIEMLSRGEELEKEED